MKAFLKFSNKAQTFDVEILIGQRLKIGRGKNNEYELKDDKVSSSHCTFLLTHEFLKISDNDSKNGTYLNGIRIDSAEVFIGDEVKIGDTVITLNEKKMEAKAIADLTFPGPAKQRIDHELRVDFTGARIQNQVYTHAHSSNNNNKMIGTPSQDKEINLRKRANTKIHLSKQEIRLRNEKLVQSARMMDLIIGVIVFMLPILYIVNASLGSGISFLGMTAESVEANKANLIGGGELLITGIFLLLNLRYMEFSVGEKLVGLEKLYTSQDQ